MRASANRRYGPGLSLAALAPGAAVAGDVELDPVAHYFAGDFAAQAPHQALDRSGPKLPDDATLNAYRVVMMPDAGQAVLWSPIEKVQPAYDADLHEQLDGPKDRRPAHPRQFAADLVRGETFLHSLQNADDRSPRSRRPIPTILKGSHHIWARGGRRRCHDLGNGHAQR